MLYSVGVGIISIRLSSTTSCQGESRFGKSLALGLAFDRKAFLHQQQPWFDTQTQTNTTTTTFCETMAQGNGKLGKAQKSKGSQKRKVVRKKTSLSKGRKSFQTKKHNLQNNIHIQAERDTTKAINRRNEIIVAAKAVSSGTRFFMKDVSEKGTKEMKKQLDERNKKQTKQKASKLSERLEDQLKKVLS